jgi:hypothetical protein
MSLVGKFFLHSSAGYYQTGEVLERAASGFYFLKFDGINGAPAVVKMFCIEDLTAEIEADGCPDFEWQFFVTRQELDDYILWMETPSEKSKPKVVKLHS